MASSVNRRDMDMTQGSIWRLLLRFSLPMMIGNVFQQLYTTVDSIVVGNFVGSEALAAVGSTGCIVNSMIGLFSGIATGAGVLISQHYGAKNEEKLHISVQMSMLITLVMSVIVTVAGVWLTPTFLDMMDTPSDVYEEAAVYLRIYFMGAVGLLIYNMGSGILRAVGDSQRPLYFLIASTLTNIVLDLVFVIVFDLGIAGVAYATVLSELISAVMVLFVLMSSTAAYRYNWREMRPDGSIIRRIIQIGIPFGLQMFITSISNVFVQAYINHYGSDCMAGWSSYAKIDQFLMLPMMSISMGVSTFAGQNFGARNLQRTKRGTFTALGISMGITVLLIIPTMLLAGFLVSMFNQDADVIAFGKMFIYWESPFYVLCCVNQTFAGTLRGIGNTKAPMLAMLASFVAFRQVYLYIIARVAPSIVAVALGYPAGWLVCSAILLPMYTVSMRKTEKQLALQAASKTD